MDRFLEKDLAVKILSVLLAIVLWFQVTSDESATPRRVFERVGVQVVGLDPALALVDAGQRPAVRVTVQGSQLSLNRVRAEDVRAQVNLAAAQPGTALYRVEVTVPKGVNITDVAPSTLTLAVEPRTARQVPIQVRTVGEVTSDYVVGQPVTKETQATVTGPKSRVDAVGYVVGLADVKGVTEDARRTVHLTAVSPDGKEIGGLVLAPESIEVTVPVNKLPPGAILTVNVRTSGQVAAGYRVAGVKVLPAQVRLRATPDQLKGIISVDTAVIDLAGATGAIVREVDLAVPAGTYVVQPARVAVTIDVAPDLLTRRLPNLPVRVRNLPDDKKATLAPSVVTAVISGPRAQVEKLGADDVVLFVDAANLGAGTQQLLVQAELPAGVQFVGAEPRTIQVEVH